MGCVTSVSATAADAHPMHHGVCIDTAFTFGTPTPYTSRRGTPLTAGALAAVAPTTCPGTPLGFEDLPHAPVACDGAAPVSPSKTIANPLAPLFPLHQPQEPLSTPETHPLSVATTATASCLPVVPHRVVEWVAQQQRLHGHGGARIIADPSVDDLDDLDDLADGDACGAAF